MQLERDKSSNEKFSNVVVLTTSDDSSNWKDFSHIPDAIFVEREFLFSSIMRQEISISEFKLQHNPKPSHLEKERATPRPRGAATKKKQTSYSDEEDSA